MWYCLNGLLSQHKYFETQMLISQFRLWFNLLPFTLFTDCMYFTFDYYSYGENHIFVHTFLKNFYFGP